MDTRPIREISGAIARSDGAVKMPNTFARMPHGGVREYKTKWIYGSIRKSSKTARHQYKGILYRGKNYKMHRLICSAFHGPAPSPKSVVIHINENALDNRPENLRWGTQKENLNAPGFVEYCKSRTGENSPVVKGALRKS
ncbi:MAG: HNH endonuclease [Epibacterium sp.]|nr:HNH endonuclease [Epibacterium sp.]